MLRFLTPLYNDTNGFRPPSIAGNVLWLDGTDPAGTGIAPSPGKISSWVDKSGSGNTFVQATSSNQPSYASAAVNSKGAIQFTRASNTYVTNSTAFMPNTNAWDLFFVIQFTTVGSGNFFYNDSHGGSVLDAISTHLTVLTEPSSGLANNTAAQTFTTTSTYLVEYNYNGSGPGTLSNFQAIVDNTLLTNGTGSAGAGTTGSSVIGSDIVDAPSALGGYVCEVIAYNSMLSSTNRTKVQNYLFSKWNY